MNLSLRGQIYVTGVIACGLIAVGICIASLFANPVNPEWLGLAVLTFLTGSFTVRVPGLAARISVSETFVFISVMLFGVSAATLTVALDTVIATLVARRKTPQPPLKILFNLGAAALSIWLAGSAYYAVSSNQPLSVTPAPLPDILGPLAAMTAIYFILNSGLVAFALSFEKGIPAFQIWRRSFLWLSINYFGGASAAALLVSYTKSVDIAAFSLILPLVVVSYLTYRTSLGRLDDANRHVDEMKRLHVSTIETLATAIDAKDQVTHGHIRRVQQHTLGLARALGISDKAQLDAIEAAALLHDLGKLVVPEHILNKPGKLSPGEFERMKLHARVGADILSSIKFPYPVVPIVRHHHENWDGTGYPDGLRRTEIPIGARILAVIDCYDALTSDRPYRGRLGDDEAVAILLNRRGSMYDPLVVDVFIKVRDKLAVDLGASAGPIVVASQELAEAPSAELPEPAFVEPELLDAIRRLVASIHANTAASAIVTFIKDDERDELFVVDVAGSDRSLITPYRTATGTRISGWVAANGARIANADSRLEFGNVFDPPRRCLVVPLLSGGYIAGAIALVSPPGLAFDDDAASRVETAARSLGGPALSDIVKKRATGLRAATPPPTVH